LFRLSGSVLILTSAQALSQQAKKVDALTQLGVHVLPVAVNDLGRLHLPRVMKLLASDFFINDVLLEAGASLTASALSTGMVDELWWYTSGAMLGEARSALAGMPLFSSMQQVARWRLLEQRLVGQDVRMRWLPPAAVND
ncbi:MAG: dihydrofolate reductase family protein, partial [Gammaproteobacteria bacterium]|nr:dihydrofolate reductase family protein [Gammaproteobacteria bacterium]